MHNSLHSYFDIEEIFYRHFSVYSSLVEKTLSAGGEKGRRKMLRKTFYICLVLAVNCVAYTGKRNRENIQIPYGDIGVFSAKLCIIKMINIYLPISYIIQPFPLSHNFLGFLKTQQA